jgi:hypothetical protein
MQQFRRRKKYQSDNLLVCGIRTVCWLQFVLLVDGIRTAHLWYQFTLRHCLWQNSANLRNFVILKNF